MRAIISPVKPADAIRCDSKDGILTVHVPKTEVVKNKPIQITVQ